MDIRESSVFCKNIQRHFWEVARLKFIKNLIKRSMPTPATVIDIGCGDCFVLYSLAELFPMTKFIGIDTALTEDLIEQLTVRSDIGKNISLYRKMEHKTEDKTDLILMLDVLEHIEDEISFLDNLHSLLHKNSKLIITVPAFQTLFTDHDRFLRHYRRYNRKKLQKVLENSGFRVTYYGYIFCTLLPFRILQKLFRVKSAQQNSLRAGNKFINIIATLILQIDASVTFWLSCKKIYVPGLSCFAVAELNCEK